MPSAMPPSVSRSIAPSHAPEERRVLAGVDVVQCAGRRIEHGEEQRDEARAGRVAAHLHVQARDELGRAEPLVDERAQHREQQRHQQRRRAALAGTSPSAIDEAAVGQRQDVVEVAADRVGRPGERRTPRARRRSPSRCGSIACWISRAISRSFFSDSRSATSSSTSRFISEKPPTSQQRAVGPGEPGQRQRRGRTG